LIQRVRALDAQVDNQYAAWQRAPAAVAAKNSGHTS
jgi:hypothetical protein